MQILINKFLRLPLGGVHDVVLILMLIKSVHDVMLFVR